MAKHAVISLSGGMDSACLLAYLLQSQDYEFIHCYGFDYGQRHSVELERAKGLVKYLELRGMPISYQLINVRDVFSSSQSALGASRVLDVPKETYATENLKDTVVENRNVIFSSIVYGKALAISKKYNVRVDITLGVHASDNQTYPDTRPASTEMAKELFRISNYSSDRIDYVTPFISMPKSQVLGCGLSSLDALGIPYKEYFINTSSCYDPDDEGAACGLCATCRDRLEAFERAGLEDPVPYSQAYKDLK